MNLEQAFTIIENNRSKLEEKTYIKIVVADKPLPLIAPIAYKEVCDASMYLFNAPFVTEIKMYNNIQAHRIIPDKEGLDKVLEKAKDTKLEDAPVSPRFNDLIYNRMNLGILHSFAGYNNARREFHTHQVMHDNLEDANYFFSETDLIYGSSIMFFPLNYTSLSRIRSLEELEQEKQATARRMEESEVKGFMIKLSDDLHTITQWWDALDHLQEADTTALVIPIIMA